MGNPLCMAYEQLACHPFRAPAAALFSGFPANCSPLPMPAGDFSVSAVTHLYLSNDMCNSRKGFSEKDSRHCLRGPRCRPYSFPCAGFAAS